MSFGSILIAEHLSNYNTENLHKSEVHLNLLKVVNQKRLRVKVEYYLDVGIKLLKYNNTVETITMYFPFSFVAKDIEDLGKKLSNSKPLVNVIFNENMQYGGNVEGRSSLNKYRSTLGNETERKIRSFVLYNLAEDNYIVEPIDLDGYCGTSLTIQLTGVRLPDAEKHENLYFRFRLPINENNQKWLKRDENLSNDVFQAAFSKTELYDIRINDRRETSDKVLEKIEKDNTLLPFVRTHFFFVTSVVDQVTNGTLEQMDTRMMELDRWEDYMPYEDKHPRIAYQWKKIVDENSAYDNFEIFFRNTCDNRNYRKILLYLFVAFWIGAVGSTIANIGLKWGNVSWVVVLMTIIIVGCYFRKP